MLFEFWKFVNKLFYPLKFTISMYFLSNLIVPDVKLSELRFVCLYKYGKDKNWLIFNTFYSSSNVILAIF